MKATGFAANGLLIRTDANGNTIFMKQYAWNEGIDITSAIETSNEIVLCGDYLVNGNTGYRLMLMQVLKTDGTLTNLKGFSMGTLAPFRPTMKKYGNEFMISLPVFDFLGSAVKTQYVLRINSQLQIAQAYRINQASGTNEYYPDITILSDGSIAAVYGAINGGSGYLNRIGANGQLLNSVAITGESGVSLNTVSAISGSFVGVFGVVKRANGRRDILFSRVKPSAPSLTCGISNISHSLTASAFVAVSFTFDAIVTPSQSFWQTVSPGSVSLNFLHNYACPAKPDIDFSYEQDYCNHMQVSFSAKSNSLATTWSFGDGTPLETGMNVSHQFARPGD
jgi:hypothetical protein